MILPAFSLSVASLPLTEPAASITCCMVPSMRDRPTCPVPASPAACSAALDTSWMVRTRSRAVAEISREVAPICVVVAAVSVAVACCWRAVAAISLTEVVTWIAVRWAWPTSEVSSPAIWLKPSSTSRNSSLRRSAMRRRRSPPRMPASRPTIDCIGTVIERSSR
ncbi:hypothetical protein D3C81_1320280 [compost metagenome]